VQENEYVPIKKITTIITKLIIFRWIVILEKEAIKILFEFLSSRPRMIMSNSPQ
jgi:hypothetical protein